MQTLIAIKQTRLIDPDTYHDLKEIEAGTEIVGHIKESFSKHSCVLDENGNEKFHIVTKHWRKTTAAWSALNGMTVAQEIETAFQVTEGEVFRDGFESNLVKKLSSLIEKYGDYFFLALINLIAEEKLKQGAVGEVLRWLGQLDHPETYERRFWLLTLSLKSSSIFIREGAIAGIASMGDKRSVPHIEAAIKREKCLDLKLDMESALEHLS